MKVVAIILLFTKCHKLRYLNFWFYGYDRFFLLIVCGRLYNRTDAYAGSCLQLGNYIHSLRTNKFQLQKSFLSVMVQISLWFISIKKESTTRYKIHSEVISP